MSICPICRKEYPPAEKFCAADGSELLSEPTPGPDARIGTMVGNYRLLEKLGEGGMGTVYKAEHPGLGRLAAVKLLRSEYAQETEMVLRFFDEARAVNKIRNKHILDVFDLGRTPEGAAYLIAELLIGEDLERRLKKNKKLPIEEICTILGQVCDALQAAHSAGIVHRDLKPENIFLSEQEDQKDFVKVVDFGIAKLLQTGADGLSRTKTGIVMGTPHYMSPEQATGKKELDGRSDLYSLGVILYECLAGQTPFRGDTMAGVVMQHVLEKPPPLKKVVPEREIPEALVSLTMRLLEKDPAQRPGTANEVKAVLQKFGSLRTGEVSAAVVPVVAPPPGEKVWEKALSAARQFWEKLNPQQKWAAGGIFLFLLIFFLLPSSEPKVGATLQESPLFQPKGGNVDNSRLPPVCNELFALACVDSCEAVRVSNCETVKGKILGFESQMKASKTSEKEMKKQLEASCKETKKSLESIRADYCR